MLATSFKKATDVKPAAVLGAIKESPEARVVNKLKCNCELSPLQLELWGEEQTPPIDVAPILKLLEEKGIVRFDPGTNGRCDRYKPTDKAWEVKL